MGHGRQPQPGSIAGGSGTQYFVGDFYGTRFTADNVQPYMPPAGEVFEDFEASDYGDWTTTGTAFGSGPATGPRLASRRCRDSWATVWSTASWTSTRPKAR